jgi:putative spermidine/putrescine transport system ATP-binding protein
MALGEAAGGNTIRAKLSDIVFQGSRVQAHFVAPENEPIQVESVGALPAGIEPGSDVAVSWRVADTLLYPRATA